MGASPDGEKTDLSTNLDDSKALYLCNGSKPWLGTTEVSTCGRPLRASLRSAANVYFAIVRSSIYLPRSSGKAPPDLILLFEKPPISSWVNILRGVDISLEQIDPKEIRRQYPQLLEEYSDDQIIEALGVVLGVIPNQENEYQLSAEEEDQETAFRRVEFNTLRTERNEEYLSIKATETSYYEKQIGMFFKRITLIDKLRETRVLSGFTRVFPETDQEFSELNSMLWRHTPEHKASWLPAQIVYGEGIFIEFNEDILRTWETKEQVTARIEPLIRRYQNVQAQRHLKIRSLIPRFIMIHTFAHLLINRLIFECGYSSASLRERLYISANNKYPMGGLLVYTAAGDVEGTMGGLVRMGKPGNLEPVIGRALEAAAWCSADPVCMEIGGTSGQGPDSCNLAACHNCALVPETTCEEFNRFLDRGLLVGEPDDSKLGYFSHISSIT